MTDENALYLRDWINIIILIVTIVAIVIGPIIAVRASKWVDDEREKRARQYRIFHELMRTRKTKLSVDHVMALNLVQIEFYGIKPIIDAFQTYIEKLSTHVPPPPESERLFKQWDDTFFNLLNKIGHHLGYDLDKRDLDTFSYVPIGWENDEFQQRQLRIFMIEALQGKRPIPVASFRMQDLNNKFPPAPS